MSGRIENENSSSDGCLKRSAEPKNSGELDQFKLQATSNLNQSPSSEMKGVSSATLQNDKRPMYVQDRKNVCAACRVGSRLFAFSMAFQPIVDLQYNRIDAYEALVRGPAAEGAAHVLNQVDSENTYAFDQACRVKAIELAASLGMDRQLSINFLPNAVYDPRACIQTTLKTAARTGFPLHRLTFEILESETVADTQHLLKHELPRPIGQSSMPPTMLPAGALGWGKRCQERQGPDPAGPGDRHQQHQAEPAQAGGFHEMPVG